MKSLWTLAVVNQLASGLVHVAMREFVERHPAAPDGVPETCAMRPRTPGTTEARTALDVVKLVAFTMALVVLGSVTFGWLGSLAWWLATGRGPGGRLLAAGAVTPRPYNFRN